LANFYKIAPEAILVAHDELDIAPGTVRLKTGGGHGGHNGLRDIISSLGNQKQFGRLRIGIGHPGNAKQVSNFVLKKAPNTEQRWIEDSIDEVVRHIEAIVKGDWQLVMNQLHSFNEAESDSE
jgi:PTH1 family peptidyl-tRNA hydrolase